MTKKLILIIISIFTLNCSNGQTSDSLIDKKFEDCFKEQQEKLLKEYSFDKANEPKERDIYNLFERFLIEEKLLNGFSKTDYKELLAKIQSMEMETKPIKKFATKLGFDPHPYFWTITSLKCHAQIINELKLIDDNDWRYKVALEYNYHEASDKIKTDNKYLINGLKLIPKEKFKKMYYKQMFLNEIYSGL